MEKESIYSQAKKALVKIMNVSESNAVKHEMALLISKVDVAELRSNLLSKGFNIPDDVFGAKYGMDTLLYRTEKGCCNISYNTETKNLSKKAPKGMYVYVIIPYTIKGLDTKTYFNILIEHFLLLKPDYTDNEAYYRLLWKIDNPSAPQIFNTADKIFERYLSETPENILALKQRQLDIIQQEIKALEQKIEKNEQH